MVDPGVDAPSPGVLFVVRLDSSSVGAWHKNWLWPRLLAVSAPMAVFDCGVECDGSANADGLIVAAMRITAITERDVRWHKERSGCCVLVFDL